MTDLAKEHGLNFSTLYQRWIRLGEPMVVCEGLTAPINREMATRKDSLGYDLDGVHYSSLEKVAAKINKSPWWVRDRYLAHGSRSMTSEEMNSIKPPLAREGKERAKPGEGKKKKKHCMDGRRKNGKSKATDPKYLDPEFLPDIKFADLCHLSDKKNTGAARKDCIDFIPTSGALASISGKTIRLGLPL